MKKFLISLVALFATMTVSAQFDGAVGTEGCRAINISNPRIQSWALGVEVQRGFQGNSTTNYASYGKPYNAQGCPDSTTTTCVSLGDGGIALITFSSPIIDGEGEDFCVFENGFNSTYLELGFVEVSSDGEHFYRFPATSYTTYNDIRPELLNNIAGKHEVGWGTPFDLSEIEDDEFFNRNNVRYVRIVDIIGGVDTDSQGNVIYDGTSGGPSTGYDLTGVGVLNQGSSYFVADCEGLLTSADTHELISADNGEMDADGNYRLSYLSNGLLYDALGLYGGMFACGFGPSNHTTSTGVTSYTSASLCGLEGAGNTYMIGYYSDWIGTEEHNVVRKEDDTPFYPIGVYVNNSMSAYNYMNTASFANDGHYLNIIATGYDENGNVTGSSITSLANANNIVKEWKYFDLTPLNECVKVVFTLQTDDDSGYGMNIPAYFCIDAFSYANTLDETTPCETIATFPYFEGFEGISELSENCWTSEIISGTHDWFISQFAVNGAEPFEGSQIAKIFYSTDVTRLNTPVFDLSSLTQPYLKFSFVNPQLNGQGENLVVQYKTSSESDWVDLMTINTPHNNWITDSIALPNASESYQIGFKIIGVNALGAGLDAIHIYDASTPCDAPTNLSASNITETSAEITWNGTATTYEFKLNGGEAETLTTTTKALTGLTPNTAYTVEVRSICEEQTSDWVSANFTTLEEQVVIELGEVTTSPATEVGNTSATLNGALVSAGESENFTVGFALATVADFTLEDNNVQNITATLNANTFSQAVNDLVEGQTYFYRAYITNEAGTAYGAVETFTLSSLTDAIAGTITATIYPNPATDNATMEIIGLDQDAKIVISDLQGRILSQEAINAGETHYTINVSNMASGVYYIRIVTDKAVSTQKLIVE